MKHLRRIKGILFNEYNFDERQLSIKKILLIIIYILVPSLNFEIYMCPLTIMVKVNIISHRGGRIRQFYIGV